MARLVLTVAILLASVDVVLLCVPIAHINPSTCAQIQPGMTLREAEALIGGAPDWYDGVYCIEVNDPPSKDDWPTWVGSEGKIILELDFQQRCVVKAQFYPGQVVARSISQFVWERLTRRGFGTGRPDLVVDATVGFFTGLAVVVPVVVSAVFWRRQGGGVWPYFLCFLGAIFSLALLMLSVGILIGVRDDGLFLLLGASVSALACFIVGSVITEKQRLVKLEMVSIPTRSVSEGGPR